MITIVFLVNCYWCNANSSNKGLCFILSTKTKRQAFCELKNQGVSEIFGAQSVPFGRKSRCLQSWNTQTERVIIYCFGCYRWFHSQTTWSSSLLSNSFRLEVASDKKYFSVVFQDNMQEKSILNQMRWTQMRNVKESWFTKRGASDKGKFKREYRYKSV